MSEKCIDYEAAAKERYWWLNKTGGPAADCLTVLDTFAVAAMGAMIAVVPKTVNDAELAQAAYLIAAAMMDERTKQESNDA